MQEQISSRLTALDAQIRNLESLKERWEKAEGLDRRQLAVRELTLELLEGTIKDLLQRRQEMLSATGED